jgi:hypothetical protein
MRRLVLALCLALVACAPPPAPTDVAAPPLPCDDGGSGGVLIDGVCL